MSIRINGNNYDSTVDRTYDEAGQVYVGVQHLAANPELFMPQGTNHFYLQVDFSKEVDGSNIYDSDLSSGDEETLRLSVKSATVPHFTQSVIEVPVGNGTLKFAGRWSFEGGTLEIYDWIGADTKRILTAWQNKSGNIKTEKVGLASDYKKTAYLVETTPDGQRVRSFKMYGCWISGLSEEAHNVDGSDSRVITATIQYDYAEIDE